MGLHCEDCIKKILKAIKKIEGIRSHPLYDSISGLSFLILISPFFGLADIETYNVDTQLNKVIVTGNVTEEEVIRVLQKIGKTASNWQSD